jgi:hypothetical protein
MLVDFHTISWQAFRSPDPRPLNIPKDTLPDPNDNADFELPDQNALIHAFLAGLFKESPTDFRSLSQVLATLPAGDSSQTLQRPD